MSMVIKEPSSIFFRSPLQDWICAAVVAVGSNGSMWCLLRPSIQKVRIRQNSSCDVAHSQDLDEDPCHSGALVPMWGWEVGILWTYLRSVVYRGTYIALHDGFDELVGQSMHTIGVTS